MFNGCGGCTKSDWDGLFVICKAGHLREACMMDRQQRLRAQMNFGLNCMEFVSVRGDETKTRGELLAENKVKRNNDIANYIDQVFPKLR